jgi:hypothetical protein
VHWYLTAEGCAHLTTLTALTQLRLDQCSAFSAGDAEELPDCDDISFISEVGDRCSRGRRSTTTLGVVARLIAAAKRCGAGCC